MLRAAAAVLVSLCALQAVAANGRVYHRGDNVLLYANKVGPYGNPSEQYEYYTLPFCAPKEEERKPHHLGEILVGDRMMKTLYVLPFLISFEKRTLCSYTLKSKEIEMFQKAIDEDYYFEMFYDDLPVHGFIGEKTTEVVNGANVTMYSLYTHYIFTIGHNGEQVLEIQWGHDPQSNLDITDSVEPTDVHSIYTVLLLLGFLGTILMRILKNDFMRYA